MSVRKFISPVMLLEYLEQEVTDALVRHGIRSMFSYAWVDEHTPSSEFIGLAKWSLDGIQHRDHDETDRGYYSEAEHAQICVISTDLEELMDMSAVSIGQTLWLADQVKADVLGKNQFFWLNHINSLTLLGMVSDRVRDLFMAIYFRTSLAAYKKEHWGKKLDGDRLQPNSYEYPFVHASLEEGREEVASQLAALKGLAAELQAHRARRNETVHEIATREAEFTKQYFANGSKRRATNRLVNPYMRTEQVRTMTKNHQSTVDGAVQISTDWYSKLVIATSLIFDLEYELRNRFRLTT